MKVKELEWENINFGYMYISTAKMYTILNVSYRDQPQIIRECKFANEVFHVAKNLKEAKQACQEHYEKFILSQIEPEPVKEFDPTLLGFELFEQYLEENRYIKRLKEINELGFNSAFTLDHIKNKNVWVLKFCKSAKMEILIFPEIKIIDHDFGVKLISQFLEGE
jgi:hypothetical protein